MSLFYSGSVVSSFLQTETHDRSERYGLRERRDITGMSLFILSGGGLNAYWMVKIVQTATRGGPRKRKAA